MSIFWIIFFGVWGVAIAAVLLKMALVGGAMVLTPFYRVFHSIVHWKDTKERWRERLKEDRRWKLVFWLWGAFALLLILVIIVESVS